MIILILLVTVFVFLLFNLFRRSRRLPPGPTPLPLIGNIHQLVYQSWRGKGIVAALDYFRKKYGNAYTIWLGPMPTVNITDYEMSHEVFIKHGKKCYDKQLAPILEHISGGRGLLFANGENWAEMRRFTLLTFRRMGVGSGLMEKRIMDELNGRCSELDSEILKKGKAIVSAEFINLTVGSVINSFLIGKRFDEDTKHEFLKLKQLFDASGETFNVFDLNVPVWFLKWFFPKRFRMTWDSSENIINHVSKEAVERLRKLNSGEYEIDSEEPNDYVDCYLAKMKEEMAKGADGHPAYTMESLKLVLHDLWLAGQGTTASTLYVGLTKLVNHPNILLNIRKELQEVTQKSRDLTLQDRPNTPYLNAVIAEIQRHSSILNMNFWRINHETIKFQGYELEPGCMLTAQLGALHVNDEIYEDTEKFDPERFLKDEKSIQQLIPFGIGKRSCIGEQIAKSELYLVFGNILLRYDAKAHGATPTNGDIFPYSAAKFPDASGKFEFFKL